MDENIKNTFTDDSTRAIEAILFAAGCPVTYEKLALALNVGKAEIKEYVESLKPMYVPRGIELVTYAESCVLCTKSVYEEKIKTALDLRRTGTLSNSSLEVLAVIARNQPVTRAYVEQVRGIDSAYTISLLCDRGLIEPVGKLDMPGRPLLYATTEAFLRCFGIDSLDELGNVQI